MNTIYLIGFMGAGKTTVGQLLASKTKRQFQDIDEQLVVLLGCSVNEYFHQFGEEKFRQLEHQVLTASTRENQIISTGGGIVLKADNRDFLKKQAFVVYLKAELPVFIQRIREDRAAIRPLATEKTTAEIEAVYTPRVKLYEECASLIIDTSNLSPEEVVAEILLKLRD